MLQSLNGEGNVRKWCRLFKKDRSSLHDEERNGHSSLVTEDIKEKVNTKICEDRRFAGYELHENLFGRPESEE
jgi:transposase